MKQLTLILSIVIFAGALHFIFGDSDKTTGHNDWSAFDKFVALDNQDNQLSCSDLVATKMRRSSDYEVGILRFLYNTEYNFKACKTEIGQKIDSFCENNLLISDWISKYRNKSPIVIHFCTNHIKNHLKGKSYHYTLPTTENGFLLIEELRVMIDPTIIKKITFDTEVNNALWSLTLHTEDTSYGLYFSDEELWSKAKRDFSKIKNVQNNYSLGMKKTT